MSQRLSRSQSVYAVVLVALLFACAASAWLAWSAEQTRRAAREQLGECQQLARRIQALRTAPSKAEEVTRGHEELAQQIERWSRAARIDAQQIVSVSPLSPRRVADSDYQEVGAEVDLAGVTLRQLAELADQIAASDEQLTLSDLRLQSPRDQATDGQPDEAWNAEVALTYLLYSPKSPSR